MKQQRAKKANPFTLGLLFIIVGGITFFLWGLPPLKDANESENQRGSYYSDICPDKIVTIKGEFTLERNKN